MKDIEIATNEDEFIVPEGVKALIANKLGTYNTPPQTATKSQSTGAILAERRAVVFELIKQGWSAVEISKALKISVDLVMLDKNYVLKELKELRLFSAAGYLDLELARLDSLYANIWPMAIGGKLAAVDRLLAITKVRMDLLGLIAPVEIKQDNRQIYVKYEQSWRELNADGSISVPKLEAAVDDNEWVEQ